MKAIEINQNSDNAYYNLGNIFQDIGKYYDAINLYKKAIRIDLNLASAQAGLITSSSQICDWNDQYNGLFFDIESFNKNYYSLQK